MAQVDWFGLGGVIGTPHRRHRRERPVADRDLANTVRLADNVFDLEGKMPFFCFVSKHNKSPR